MRPLGAIGALVDRETAQAAAVEEFGYPTLWVSGGRLDRLDRIDELAAATSDAAIGTAVVPLGVRSVDEVVRLHRDVPRAVLGLGGQRTLAQFGADLDALDAAGVGPDERLLAALGPRKLALAGERAAGAITLLVTPEFVGPASDAVSTVVVQLPVVIDTDPGRARDLARGTLGFLVRVAGYRNHLLRTGFTEADLDGLSDRLVDTLVPWGTADEVAERIHAFRTAGADHVAVHVLADALDGLGRLAPLLL